jgi:type IV pilus assembly protein PilY1
MTALIGLGAISPVYALDTDIYFSDPTAGTTLIKPNLMLILDTSGSMNEVISGTTQSRVDVMKGAIKTVLDDLSNINVGLMRFSSDPGGPIMYPITDIDAAVTDTGKIQNVMQDAQDDASQDSGGTVTNNGTSLRFNSSNPHAGLRFQDVYIPQGATITSAKIVFHAAETDSGSVSLRISADAADNTPTYATTSNNVSGRAQTTATVDWSSVASWTTNNYH